MNCDYIGVMLYHGHYSLENGTNDNIKFLARNDKLDDCVYNSLIKMHTDHPYHFIDENIGIDDFVTIKSAVANKLNVIGPLGTLRGLFSIGDFYKMMAEIISKHNTVRIDSQLYVLLNEYSPLINAVIYSPCLSNDVTIVILNVPSNITHIVLSLNYSEAYCNNIINQDKLLIRYTANYNELNRILKYQTIEAFYKFSIQTNEMLDLRIGEIGEIVNQSNNDYNMQPYQDTNDSSNYTSLNGYLEPRRLYDDNNMTTGLFVEDLYGGNPIFGTYIINVQQQ